MKESMKEKLVRIHNILLSVEVKGESTINLAECIIELREIVQNFDNYIAEQNEIIELIKKGEK